MANIETQFLGLNLSSPIIVGSSGLTGKTGSIIKMAEAGAGAVVLKSLFEEQILAGIAQETRKGGVIYGQGDIDEYIAFYERKHSINEYMELIRETKKSVSIPVIASINAASDKEWQAICSDLDKSGADALQLNLFITPFDVKISGEGIEDTYVSIVRKVKALTSLPLAVKIGPYFSNIGHLVSRLTEAGAGAVVLFNRYASPDIDIQKMSLKTASVRSSDTEYRSSLRWTALLSHRIESDIAAATGIYDGLTAVKLLLAGAKAVEVVSTVYQNGEKRITEMNESISKWMDENSFTSINDFIGKMSAENTANALGLERVQYMKKFGDI
ncbi:MAG: dihydroorotate dehydrogenase-like protein [Spirochaetaceae bacterium]|nr:dihydroorotate dehydrogenase-like protein [Spirochaetaceae bacterium]